MYNTPPREKWIKLSVTPCACGDPELGAHVHLPTYVRVGENADGTLAIEAPPEVLTKGGDIDAAFIESAYEGSWFDANEQLLPAPGSAKRGHSLAPGGAMPATGVKPA